jgi:protein-ribulosamine 3-kinase
MIPPFILMPLSDAQVVSQTPVSGGSINECFHVKLADGQAFFLKRNTLQEFPGMFETEKKGLEMLAQSGAPTPHVLAVWEEAPHQFLLQEFLEQHPSTPSQWETAGEHLAKLHRTTADSFGLDHTNYMGSLMQRNNFCGSFQEFFIVYRLGDQIRIARDSNLLESSLVRAFERLFLRFDELVPLEKPALIHGDLWSGNMHETKSGIYFIDPAVAFSHRETDIAMTQLFDKLPEAFYWSYNEAYPMEKGWIDRVELFNLYPLLIHLNLFGQTYLSAIQSTLKRF